MDETTVLILLVIVMFIGSYLSGNIPIALHMSEEKLQVVSALGSGLLVGTALAVIIPEGIRSLDSNNRCHDHKPSSELHRNADIAVTEKTEAADIHSIIGVSLVLGFIFMLLIDQCSASVSRDVEGGVKQGRNITATIGLVVHAAADGIALGAAATTSHADVEMIVFIAIMLHKAPASFGLVTFLLKEGLPSSTIRKHLLIFSASAPTLALLTYFCIGQEGKETLSSVNATGIAMLFSAGTFLYVATVHVLPELTSKSSHRHGVLSSENMEKRNGLGLLDLIFLCLGAFLPLLLTLGHSH